MHRIAVVTIPEQTKTETKKKKKKEKGKNRNFHTNQFYVLNDIKIELKGKRKGVQIKIIFPIKFVIYDHKKVITKSKV